MNVLRIHSGQGDYDVTFEPSLDGIVAMVGSIPKAVFAIDRRIAALYRTALSPIIDAKPTCLVDATEDEKTIDGVKRLCGFLQGERCNKQTTLVAIGGGIIQDICTFSSHVYYRGLKWFFVPTTLLSMSDSCIGAKCGINLGDFKNQLGVFHSPSGVAICSRFVDTLGDGDVASGYGEILKLLFTGSAAAFQELRDAVSRDGLRGPRLAELVRASLEVKKAVIEEDEYENDLRRILNYGHTFGHSLEAVTRHEVPHGLAVAWGMDIINHLAWKRGWMAEADFVAVHDFIARHLPFRLSRKVGADELIDGARRDKKTTDGGINLAIAARAGALKIVKVRFDEEMRANVAEYLDRHDVFCRD